MRDPVPGLRMVLPDLDRNRLGPPAAVLKALPAGYGMRTYRPGDEAAWARLMNTGEMGTWTVERAAAELTGVAWPQFDPEGLYFVTGGGMSSPVGSACAWLVDPTETATGTLHMVCVHPAHRGRRIGHAVCLAVLHRFVARGFEAVALNTDDWRLGALKIYFDLGFRPVYRHERDPDRWSAVLQKLRWPHRVEPVTETGGERE